VTSARELLADADVTASTPDGTVFGRLSGRRLHVWFAPGYYSHTSDSRLAEKLGQLGRLLWVARMKEYYRLKSDQLGQEVRGERRPTTPKQVARREARDNIVATGRSDDGRVELTTVGMLSWTASIAPGTVSALSEEAFAAATAQAGERVVEDHAWRLKLTWSASY
jgi:hypothetical protein